MRAQTGPPRPVQALAPFPGQGFGEQAGARAVPQPSGERRPRPDLLAETLAWESSQGLDRPRRAGLSAHRERELLQALG